MAYIKLSEWVKNHQIGRFDKTRYESFIKAWSGLEVEGVSELVIKEDSSYFNTCSIKLKVNNVVLSIINSHYNSGTTGFYLEYHPAISLPVYPIDQHKYDLKFEKSGMVEPKKVRTATKKSIEAWVEYLEKKTLFTIQFNKNLTKEREDKIPAARKRLIDAGCEPYFKRESPEVANDFVIIRGGIQFRYHIDQNGDISEDYSIHYGSIDSLRINYK